MHVWLDKPHILYIIHMCDTGVRCLMELLSSDDEIIFSSERNRMGGLELLPENETAG